MKLTFVLLAAGEGRRFGSNKLLHHFCGKPMYRYLVDEIGKLPDELLESKMIVTQYKQIGEALKTEGFTVVENLESHLGISHSIHLALETEDSDAYCFAVCDQPYLKAETITGLIKGWKESGRGLGCLSNGGELGNPAIFAKGYKEELMALEGDVGGKKVIRRHPDDLYRYEVEDEKELVDIDVRP